MVDLLRQRHQQGRRFEPSEFIEEESRVAVAMTVSNSDSDEETAADVFKVFAFEGEHAVLMQDCIGRDDALARLAAG